MAFPDVLNKTRGKSLSRSTTGKGKMPSELRPWTPILCELQGIQVPFQEREQNEAASNMAANAVGSCMEGTLL